MRRIEIEDFLLIAELHCGIAAERLAQMPRVMKLGEAALQAPFAGFGTIESFPTLHEKAAVYCVQIVRHPPLPAGNRRTAYDVMREFLDRNGADFTHPPDGLDETARTIDAIATGALDEAALAAWVLERIARPEG